MVVALAIEGARSSWRRLSWDDLNSLQFPIVNKTVDFHEQVTRGRLRDVNVGATALIESVQPYNSRDSGAPKRSLLAMLSYLDNSDKHRILTTSAMAPIAEKVL